MVPVRFEVWVRSRNEKWQCTDAEVWGTSGNNRHYLRQFLPEQTCRRNLSALKNKPSGSRALIAIRSDGVAFHVGSLSASRAALFYHDLKFGKNSRRTNRGHPASLVWCAETNCPETSVCGHRIRGVSGLQIQSFATPTLKGILGSIGGVTDGPDTGPPTWPWLPNFRTHGTKVLRKSMISVHSIIPAAALPWGQA
jgi:hypothetical protein